MNNRVDDCSDFMVIEDVNLLNTTWAVGPIPPRVFKTNGENTHVRPPSLIGHTHAFFAHVSGSMN